MTLPSYPDDSHLHCNSNYQFTSDLSLKGKTLDIVDEVKLLGVIISNDLKWDKHVTEANIRMKLHQNSQKVLVI